VKKKMKGRKLGGKTKLRRRLRKQRQKKTVKSMEERRRIIIRLKGKCG
jgi:hypothetical protein